MMADKSPSLSSLGSDGNTSFLRAARAGHLDKVLEHLKQNIDINTSNANGLNALHLASKDGHVQVVEELLKRGAAVDAATKKGNTALHIASLAGQEEVVRLLVQHGASVNVQSQNGFTPLYMAAQENHDNVVKYLLANGANQSLATEDGFTPLAVAMQQGHDKVVTVLLENDTRGKVRLPALHIAAKKDDVKAAKLLLENEHNPDVTSKSGFTPLHIASHYGNESIANLLIQKGADVNYAAKHNISPLHVAAKWGKTNMVALLLDKGANIETKTRDGLTPLHCAARSGHEQVVDMLLERGAPISSKTKNGLAPLHMAAQGDHVDAARILLYHRAPVDEVTVDYLTALHVAAHCGHARVAKLLLDRGADANARALNGFTPLHIACKKNRIKVVELLLKHGASIGATTESGLTPLHVASFMGCMNIVIYLLQHEANPDVPTVRGETPLHLAARANQTDIIRILLRNGANVDARAREQQTPLHIASRLGNVDIVMLLLQHGAKVDTTTKDMYTALHIAAKEGQDEVATALIDNGASLNATTKKGFTPLHLAAKYGNIKVAKLLLQKEAPVDAQGKNGVTPLHVASHYDHQNVALLLLDKGASPHATAKNGHTPLHIAAKKNQMDIANTLLEYGAQPNAESKAGFTPLHLSSQEGHTDMSSLLIEHQADTNHQAKNGLTPLHLCAQEDRVPVAEILLKNGAEIDAQTKGGYTPLHVASHYGQTNMVKFLLASGANVKSTTSIGYTPLHQAAQQGHTNIVNVLLENSAQPNAVTMNGQTPLNIAQKLGYISVIETLKVVTETTVTTTTVTTTEEKYRVVAPEAMQETFMSDSEEEGGEDTLLGDHAYRYLTADEMKSLGDDSLPIDVTKDERIDSNRMVTSGDSNILPPQAIEDSISPQHIQQNYIEYARKYAPDNVDISRHPINIGFLVSFLVDARGGAMRGCRHSGVRVIVPPRCAPSPTRITCRYVRPQRTPHPPPLMEGEALASRVLELGPVGVKFLGPVIIEVPHFAALRGKEREIVILRSDTGDTWREHIVDSSEDILNDVLSDSFEADDLNQMEDPASGRLTRIVTSDFPQYFAVVSRVKQEVHAIGPEGGMVSSTVVPQVQAVFPQGALTKKIKVGLQAQPIDPELTAKLLGHGVAVSPVVTVEPRRRKFHKAITLSMPAPRAHSQGMINQYSGSAPTLRLLCSITGGTTRAQWEDVTGSTPLTFVNDCVSFTTTVSARFWLMDCRNIGDATKMATELYKEAIHVPFMAKFVVFAKRVDPLEARLRVFCMTDDKEDKTLEHQEHFTEVAKSRDVEVLEGKPQYIEFAGNLVPITKSGEQLQFSFRAFRENRLPFSVRVKDQHAEAVGRSLFMKEAKIAKGEPPQQPICILNIVLPDDIISETISLTDSESWKRPGFLKDSYEYYRPDPRLADMSNLLGEDWVPLANQLGLTTSEINVIKSEYPDSVAKQAQSMLRMWIAQSGNRAQGNVLENALIRIGREDIIPQCLNVEPVEHLHRKDEVSRLSKDYYDKERFIDAEDHVETRERYEDKYSAEEKIVDEISDEDENFKKTVSERRNIIEKRLSAERAIPASSQRVEIVQEISTIKRQSLVEDKIAEVEEKQKTLQEPTKTVTTKTTTTPDGRAFVETVEQMKTTKPLDAQQLQMGHTINAPYDTTTVTTTITEVRTTSEQIPTTEPPLEKIQVSADRRDSDLLEGVTQRLEDDKKTLPRITGEDPNSPKFSKTPPPSPADFIIREQAAAVQEWDASGKSSVEEPISVKGAPAVAAIQQGISTSTSKPLARHEDKQQIVEKPVDDVKITYTQPITGLSIVQDVLSKDLKPVFEQTNALIQSESKPEPYNDVTKKFVTPQHESRRDKVVGKVKEKSVSRDSSREDEKKSKKGFFGTLKTFVGKSLESDSSESEKSPKKEKKRKDKKKKKPKDTTGLPPEPPARPPRKPRLPTPPESIERKEFADIPFMEASLTDLSHPDKYSEVPQTQPPELPPPLPLTEPPVSDLDGQVSGGIKDQAHEIIDGVISDGKIAATQIIDQKKSHSPKKTRKITIAEEISKTFEPTVIQDKNFRIEIDPNKKEPQKKTTETITFVLDGDVGKVEQEDIITKPVIDQTVPIRPPRLKAHIYEELDNKVPSDIKLATTYLIQNEMYFLGWSDDQHNVRKPQAQKIEEPLTDTAKVSKKPGGFLSLFGKKSSKDVEESDEDKSDSIIEKHDRELSKETTAKDKPQTPKERKKKKKAESDESESEEQKKGGFFGKFKKTRKSAEPEQIPKPEVKETIEEVHVAKPVLSETDLKSIDDSKYFLTEEVSRYHDVKPIVESEEIKLDPKQVDKQIVIQEVLILAQEPTITKPQSPKEKKKKKAESDESEGEEQKKGGLFGKFKKTKKPVESPEKVRKLDVKEVIEETRLTTPVLSESVVKSMDDSSNFLNEEISKYHDVRPIVKAEEIKLEPKQVDKQVIIQEVFILAQESTVTKPQSPKEKKKKKAESDESEGEEQKKGGLFGKFKKTKKPVESPEKVRKLDVNELIEETQLTKPVLSESVVKSMDDSSNFLNEEISRYHDVKPIVRAEEIKPEPQQVIIQEVLILAQESTVTKPQSPKEKKKKKADSDESEGEEQKKSGLFGKFKKTKKTVESPEKVRKADVKEVIEEIQLIKPVLSESAQKSMDDSSTFLNEEISRYHDVKPIIKVEEIKPEPKQIIIQEVLILAQEPTATKPQTPKEKKKKQAESDESEGEEQKKGGFFGKFKKTKKPTDSPEKVPKPDVKEVIKEIQLIKPVLSESAQKSIDDSNTFLNEEISRYHDVKPIVKVEAIEPESRQTEKVVAVQDAPKLTEKPKVEKFKMCKKPAESPEQPEVQEIIEEMQVTKPILTEAVLKSLDDPKSSLTDEVYRDHGVKPVIETDEIKIERKGIKPTEFKMQEIPQPKEKPRLTETVITEVQIKPLAPPALSDQVIQQMSDTTGFLQTEVTRFHDVRPLKKPEVPAQEKIKVEIIKVFEVQQPGPVEEIHKEKGKKVEAEEGKDQKKGIFGIFGKKSKKEEPVTEKLVKEATQTETRPALPTPSPISENVLQQMYDTRNFISVEIARYEDVSPSKPKQPVKPQLQEEHKMKEVKVEPVDESKERRKSGSLFGIFGKKSKKDEVPEEQTVKNAVIKQVKELEATPTGSAVLSEQIKKQMSETSNFLGEEVTKYEDGRPVKASEPALKLKVKTSEIAVMPQEEKKPEPPEPKEKDKKSESDDDSKETKKGGLFGIFAKKSKKEELLIEQEILKEIEAALSAPPPVLSSKVKQEMADTGVFLQEEVARFEDVRPLKQLQTSPTKLKQQKQPSPSKRKERKSADSDDEGKERRKSGLFGLFGKKSTKEETAIEEQINKEIEAALKAPTPPLSQEVIQQIDDSTNFLKEEVERFEDVMPLKPKGPDKKDKDKKAESDDESKDQKRGGLFGLFGKKSKREESIERKIEKEVETALSASPPPLSQEVVQQMTDSSNFLQEEVARFHDVIMLVKPKKPTEETKERDKKAESDDEGKDQKKGLFGLFGKKSKREDSVEKKVSKEVEQKIFQEVETVLSTPPPPLSREVVQHMTDSSNFLKEELARFEDVMPPKPEKISLEEKPKDKKSEAEEESKDQKKGVLFGLFGKKSKRDDSVERKIEKQVEIALSQPPPPLSQEVIQQMSDTSSFLKEEVARFEDVMPPKSNSILPEEITKDKITEPGEEGKDQKRSVLFGLFGKKSKRDDSVERKIEKQVETSLSQLPPPLSQEAIQQMSDASSFLKEEVARFDDVMPPKPKEPPADKKEKDKKIELDDEDKKKGSLFGLFGKKSKREDSVERKIERDIEITFTSPPPPLSDEVVQQMEDTSNFINEEIARFEDVRLTIPKQLSEEKQEKDKKVESEEEIKDQKKIGLFGLFGKKSKREESIERKIENEIGLALSSPRPPLSTEVVQHMADSSNFLKEEVSRYEDVKPVKLRKRPKDKKEKDRKSESDDETKERRRSGLLGLFGRKSTKEDSLEHISASLAQEAEITEEVKLARARPHSEERKDKKAESDDESKERRKSGLFSVFSKKPKKEESIERKIAKEIEIAVSQPPPPLSQEVLQKMTDSSNFLTEEISRFEDVRAAKQKQPPETHKEEDIRAELEEQTKEHRKSGLFGFFEKKPKKVKSIEEKAVKSPKKQVPSPPPQLSPEVLQHMTDANNFLHGEVSRYEDVKPIKFAEGKPKAKEKTVAFDLASEDTRKGGLFGIFGKDKEESTAELPATDAVVLCDNTLELTTAKEIETQIVRQTQRAVEVLPQVPPAVSDDTLRDISNTENFLNREISVFDDVLIMPAPIREEGKDRPVAETAQLKEVEPMAAEEISLKPVESKQLTESLITKMLDTATFITEEIVRYDHGPSGSKSLDAQLVTPLEQTREEHAILILPVKPGIPANVVGATDAFIQEEIAQFQDVRPIIKPVESAEEPEASEDESVTKSALFGIFSKKKEQASPKAEKRKHKKHKKSDSTELEKVGFFEKIGRKLGSVSSETRESFEEQTEKTVQESRDKVEATNEAIAKQITKSEETAKQTKEDVATLVSAMKDQNEQIKETVKDLEKSAIEAKVFFNKVEEKISGQSQKIKDTAKEVQVEAKDKTVVVTEATGDLAKDSKDFIQETADKAAVVIQKSKDQIEKIACDHEEALDDLGTDVKEGEEKAADKTKDFLGGLAAAVVTKAEKIEDSTKKAVKDTKDAIISTKDEIRYEIDGVVVDSKEAIDLSKDSAKTAALETSDKVGVVKEKISKAAADVKSSTGKAIKDTKSETEKAAQKSGSLFGKLGDKISGKTKKVKDTAKQTKEKVKDKAAKAKDEVAATAKETKESAKEVKDNIAQKVSETGAAIKDGIAEAAEDAKEGGKDAAKEVEKAARKSGGFFSKLGDKITGKSLDLKESVVEAKDQIKDKNVEAADAVKQTTTGVAIAVKDGTKELAQIAKDKIEESAQTIKDATSTGAEDVKQGVVEAVDKTNVFMADVGDKAGQKTEELKKGTKETVHDAKKAVVDAAGITKDFYVDVRDKTGVKVRVVEEGVKEVAHDTKQGLKEAAYDAKVGVAGAADQTNDFFVNVGDKTGQKAYDFKEGAKDAAHDAKEGIVGAVDTTKDLFIDVGDKVSQKAHQLEEGAKSVAHHTIEGVVGAADKTKDAFIDVGDRTGQKAHLLKEGVKDVAHYAKEGVVASADKTKDIFVDVGDKTGQKAHQLKEGAKDVPHYAKEGVVASADKTKDFFIDVGDKTSQKAHDFKESAKDVAHDAKEGVVSAADITKDFFVDVGDKTSKKAQQLKEGAKDVAYDAKAGVVGAADKIKDLFIDVGGKTSQKAHQLKEGAKDVAHDAKEDVVASTDETKNFFVGVGDKTSQKAHVVKEGAKDVAHEAKEGVVGAADKTKDFFVDVGDKTSKKAHQLIEGAKDVAHDGKVGVVRAADKTKDFFVDVADKTSQKAHDFKEGAKDVAHDAKEGVIGAADKTKDFFIDVSDKTSKKAHQLKEGVKDVAHDAKEGVVASADKTKDFFVDVGDKTSQKAHDVKESAKDVAHDAKEGVVGAADKTKDFFVDVSDKTSKKAHQLKEGTKDVAHDAKEGVVASAEKTKDFFVDVGDKTSQKAHDVKKSAKDIAHDAQEGVLGAADKTKDFFIDVGDTTSQKAHELKQGAKDGACDTIEGVVGVADKTKDFFDDVGHKTSQKAHQFKGGAQDVAHDAKKGVVAAADRTKGILTDAGTKTRQKTGDAKENVKTTTKHAFGTVTATAKDVKDKGSEKILHAKKDIKKGAVRVGEKVSEKATDVKETTKDIGKGAKETAEKTGGLLNKLGSKIGVKTKKPKDKIAAAVATPAETSKKVEYGVRKSAETIAKGLPEQATDTKGGIRTSSKKVKDETKKVARKSAGFFNKLGDTFAGKSQELKDDAKDVSKQAIAKTAEVGKDTEKTVQEIKETVDQTVKDASDEVKTGSEAAIAKAVAVATECSEQIEKDSQTLAEAAKELRHDIEEKASEKVKDTQKGEKATVSKAEEFFDALGDEAEKFADLAKDTKDQAKDKASEVSTDAKKAAKDVAESAESKVKDATAKTGGFFGVLGEKIFGTSEVVVDSAKEVKDKTKDKASEVAIETQKVAKDAAQGAGTVVKNATAKTKGFISTLGDQITDTTQEVVDSAKDATDKAKKKTSEAAADTQKVVKGVAEGVEIEIKDATAKTGGFFGALDDKITGTTKEVVGTAIEAKNTTNDKASRVAADAQKTAKVSAEGVETGVKEATAKTSGFFSALDETIADTTKDVSDSAKEAKDKAKVETFEVASDTKQAIKYVAESVETGVKDATTKTGGFFDALGNKLFGTAEEVADSAKDSELEAAADTQTSAKEFGKHIASGAKEVADKTGGFFDALGETISDKTKDVADSANEATDKAKVKTSKAKKISEDVTEDEKTKVNKLTAKADGFFDALGDKITETTKDAAESVKETKDQVKSKASEVASDTQNTAKEVAEGVETGVKDATAKTGGFFSALGEKLFGTAEGVADSAKEAQDTAKDKALAVATDTKKIVKDVAEDTKTEVKELTTTTGGSFGALGDKITETTKDAADSVKATKDKAKIKASEVASDTQETAKDVAEGVETEVKEATAKTEGFFGALGDKLFGTAEEVADSAKKTKDEAKDKALEVATNTKKVVKDVTEDAKTEVKELTTTTGGLFGALGDKITETKKDAADSVKETKDKAKDKTSEVVSDTQETAKDVVDGVKIGVKDATAKTGGFFSALGDKLFGTAEEVTKSAKESKDKVTADTQKPAKEVAEGIESGSKTITAKTGGLFNVLGEKVKDTTKDVADSAKEATDKAKVKTSEVATDTKKVAKDVTEDVKTEMKELTAKTGELFDALGDKITETTKDAADYVKETKDKTKSKASEVAYDTQKTTKDVAVGVETGVKDATAKTGGFFSALSDKITGTTKDVVDSTKEKAAEVAVDTQKSAQDIGKGVEGAAAQADVSISAWGTQMKDDIDNSKEKVSKKLDKAKADAGEQAKDTMKKTTGLLSKIKDSVVGKSAEVKEKVLDSEQKLKIDAQETAKRAKDDFGDAAKETSDFFRRHDKSQDDTDVIKPEDIAKTSITRTASDNVGVGKSRKDGQERSSISEKDMDLSRMPAMDYTREQNLEDSGVTSMEDYLAKLEQDEDGFVIVQPADYPDGISESKFPVQVTDLDEDDNLTKHDPSQQPKRKPLFHLESEDDLLHYSTGQQKRDSVKSNVFEALSAQDFDFIIKQTEAQTRDLDQLVQETSGKTGSKTTHGIKPELQSDVDAIEKKLEDLDKALGSLEKADQELSQKLEDDAKSERKLKRVERKFERLASETMDKEAEEAKAKRLSTPDMEEKRESDFRTVVSQLSTEELSDLQKEYSAMWDDHVLSSSEDKSAKTPGSQADAQELPQGEGSGSWQVTPESVSPRAPVPFRVGREEGTSEVPTQGPSTQPGSQQRNVADQHQLSEEMKQLLKEMEEDTKK